MPLTDLHPKAYGLNRDEHFMVVWYARNHFTEAWIAEKFNISIAAVRDICEKDHYLPPKNKFIQGGWVCFNGKEI